ncbi:MAG: flagellar protein export ATPase FliI [Gammaproteobacteria bacterium]|nr:flagellar protein export ATPase FliI [Gammaproteobacteria bacterium]MBI5615836.1 flagellar protein export ATPase FliI [Gammaproteobacteria bacterium]
MRVEPRAARWLPRLREIAGRLEEPPPLIVEGKLTRMIGLTLEAVGCQAAIGDRCVVVNGNGDRLDAEVVGFSGESLFLMPTGTPRGLAPNARVVPVGGAGDVAVGEALLGRVLDGAGAPLDGRGPILTPHRRPLYGAPINPLERSAIRDPLDVGVRSINALFTIGRGQRLGLFAPSGVGKSVLLGMMTRFTEADVIVVGLIGERGREVKEFIEDILGEEGLSRAVVVATPADTPPLMRMHGAAMATSIAEYFRDQGQHVLLLMDSLTRYAQAHREIALTIGEPPATRGFPPSVFARLPVLVERAGTGINGRGSITALYTVLTEADDANDPVADTARAILDGHILLSRKLADRGLYPAVDVESSISRTMTHVVAQPHIDLAKQFRHYHSLYEQNQDLFNVGAYQAGSNPELDRAVELRPFLNAFLRQDRTEPVGFEASVTALQRIFPPR